jgi:hypothetical protein
MKTLTERQEGIGKFVQTKYTKVVRNGQSYEQTRTWAVAGITRCLAELKALPAQDQAARLKRDELESYLVRYHNYCIKENIGAHYREVGATKKECDFEHVIPKAVARELMIYDLLTVEEALNIPTCLLRKKNHKLLNKKSASTTPDIWDFWARYRNALKVKIETHDGTPVDMSVWNLVKHYEYFNEKN